MTVLNMVAELRAGAITFEAFATSDPFVKRPRA